MPDDAEKWRENRNSALTYILNNFPHIKDTDLDLQWLRKSEKMAEEI